MALTSIFMTLLCFFQYLELKANTFGCENESEEPLINILSQWGKVNEEVKWFITDLHPFPSKFENESIWLNSFTDYFEMGFGAKIFNHRTFAGAKKIEGPNTKSVFMS